jgi:hypothetical protein
MVPLIVMVIALVMVDGMVHQLAPHLAVPASSFRTSFFFSPFFF